MSAAIHKHVKSAGGRSWHVVDSRKSPEMADCLDEIIVLPPTLYLVELKSNDRPTTSGQKEVAGLLDLCTEFVTGFVRPRPRTGEMSYDDFLKELMR